MANKNNQLKSTSCGKITGNIIILMSIVKMIKLYILKVIYHCRKRLYNITIKILHYLFKLLLNVVKLMENYLNICVYKEISFFSS